MSSDIDPSHSLQLVVGHRGNGGDEGNIHRVELAALVTSMSLSLEQAELGSSMPNLEQAELSMPNLEQAELSMPMFEDLSTRTLNDEPASETVPIDKSDARSTVILSSFIAGLSVLVVGASAMVLKMKRLRAREIEQDQPRMVYDIQVERA